MSWTLRIPRHACSPRDTSRAGDLWRLVQEAAVLASEGVGWPASRYREEGTAFVVREMCGLHLREARYGEVLPTDTCIAESRRGILLRRETWVADVMRTTVQWAHVGRDGVPKRAGPSVTEAFVVTPADPVELPAFDEIPPEVLPPFHLTPWYTEMDPLGHTNHPRYVDWADEALSRHVAALGFDPLEIVPVAEVIRFRGSAKAGDAVVIHLTRIGVRGDVSVFDVEVRIDQTHICGGRLWRRVPG
ncbi:hypothetical protein LBMAG42_10970 [Deltaproteobacteria bacterium]|nr:hypothetical protein LBMAG42_10970 [Deltaproteobacteria bacterium]